MIYKIAGGLLVCVSSLLLGIYYSLRDDFRISDLTELRRGLLMLKDAIEFSHSGLAEAMQGIGARLEAGTAAFFCLVGQRLNERDGEAEEIWHLALRDTLPATYLSDEDMSHLEGLGRTLCCLSRRTQAEGIDAVVRYLDEKTVALRAVAGKNRRLYRSVGMVCGLLLTVVLL